MGPVGRYWRTVRYLRAVQLYGRALHRWTRPAVDSRPAPAPRSLARERWVSPAGNAASMTGPDRFVFLGEEGSLAERGWDDAGIPKLWRYNLHYFDDLTSADAASRAAWHRELLVRWVRENPPAKGSGWEPFPTSLRIVNWVKWSLAGNELPPDCVQSLAVQARWLSSRLERHLLGNHLFTNATALLFAGLWFDGPEALGWLALGGSIMLEELDEQVLSDGGHFERSTMYHALALEDVLDLIALSRAAEPVPSAVVRVLDACAHRVGAMRRWLATMSHPDGEISFFNDAAFGIAPEPAALERYAARLGLGDTALGGGATAGVVHLEPSGYARLSAGPAVAIVDVAPVGPDYLPGHAHADTLSFELSLFGRRVLVNSGTSEYGLGAERLRQRGTAAHNTVVIAGQDSSEVWSGFRVGRRARPVEVRLVAGTIGIEGAHDGYRWLSGAPLHWRRWTLEASALLVEDELRGGGALPAAARLHLHPEVRILRAPSAEVVLLRMPEGRTITVRVEGASLHVEPATWHPRFGERQDTSCLVATLGGAALRTRIEWSGAS